VSETDHYAILFILATSLFLATFAATCAVMMQLGALGW